MENEWISMEIYCFGMQSNQERTNPWCVHCIRSFSDYIHCFNWWDNGGGWSIMGQSILESLGSTLISSWLN